MSGRIPDWVLERHLVGELPEGFTAADLAADPTVPERLERLRASDAEVLQQHPPRVVAANVRARAEARSVERRPAMVMRLVPVAVAAAVVAVIAPVVMRQAQQPDILTKGLEPHLEVLRAGSGGSVALEPGATVRPGDVVQLRVVGAGAKFAAVVAVDGAGAETVLTPTALHANGTFTLPDALELDAQGGLERFVLVTADRDFPMDEVLAAARKVGADRAAPLALPEGLKQSSFLLVKSP